MGTDSERAFWNNPDITGYFESKPPDPRIVDFVASYEKAPEEVRALDLGCGGGRHSELLAAHGYEVSSVDVNPAMLDRTRARLAGRGLQADIRPGSITNIPYADETFDLVVTTGVLHQAESPEEYEVAVKELSRVMKPAALVLLNVFTNAVWDDSYVRVGGSPYAVRTRQGLPMTLLPSAEFDALMERHSLACIDRQGEDIKQENTGPRAVYRAFYQKAVSRLVHGE